MFQKEKKMTGILFEKSEEENKSPMEVGAQDYIHGSFQVLKGVPRTFWRQLSRLLLLLVTPLVHRINYL